MDKLSDPSHPLWKIIRLAVVGTIMIVCCSVLYKNGFSQTDIMTIAMTLLGLGGFDQLKAMVTK
jgi:hypothetical protein